MSEQIEVKYIKKKSDHKIGDIIKIDKNLAELLIKKGDVVYNKLEKNSGKDNVQSTVTDNTDVTDVTDVTDNTQVSVTSVLCDKDIASKIFGENLNEQILKIFATNNCSFTYDKLAELLDRNEASIRQAMNRKKEYFEQNILKNRKVLSHLSHSATQEIKNRIAGYANNLAIKQETLEFQDKQEKKSKEVISEFKKYLKVGNVVYNENVVDIDFMDLAANCELFVSQELESNPEETLQAFELAIKESGFLNYDDIFVKIYNLPNDVKLNIEQLRSKHLNELISLSGRIVALSDVRPQVVNAKFECPSCGTIISVLQIEKKFREPERCSCGRRGGFKVISKEMVDTAKIILEDLQDKSTNPHTKRINAFVKEHLVNEKNISKIYPGNEVEICGILKEVPVALSRGGLSTRFELALEVNSVKELEDKIDVNNLTEEEINEIVELSANIDTNGFEEITPSFAPDIYGLDYIKEALILQISCKDNLPGQNKQKNKPHILLIGDPGVSKTVLGDFSVDITPNSRKAVGGSSSGVGITASVVKDDDGWRTEPGGLVLSKTLFFIDELNNMQDEDKPKFQEAMSEFTVTVNKATIHLTLKATSGILAVANPIHGNFRQDFDYVKQFNLPSPIINRFDLIFALKDVKNEETDKKIAERMTLRERGKIQAKYSKEFLKKFFVYIRSQENPIITDKISNILKDIYTKLRKYKTDSLNINPRVHLALLQLCKASARIRLSNEVEEKDIERALKILSHSYFKTPDYKYLKSQII